MDRLPPFRRRAVEIPFGLSHPVWIEDPGFDIDRHISVRKAAAPGGERELCQVISEVASYPLDRSRPLWEIVVVEGLDDGLVACVAKIHHSVADGVAAFELLMNVLTDDSSRMSAPEPDTQWQPEVMPTRRELIELALRSIVRNIFALPKLVWRTLVGIAAVLRHIATHPVDAPVPFQVPVTSFNTSLTPNRTVAIATLPLAEFRSLRKKLDVTLNDVLLGVCSGALRGYLRDRGELSRRSLSAGVPTNVHTGELGRLSGNHLGNLITTLRTDLDDPLERMRIIHQVTLDAKQRHEALGADMLESWIEFAPPTAYSSIMRTFSQYRLADRLPPPINLVISNVAGPRKPLYIGGSRLVALHSVGPILDGIGLNITAWSYCENLHFTILACPENMPDPWKLAAWLPPALAELQAAAAVDDASTH
jgi:diacylglycerol O-acyltransferase